MVSTGIAQQALSTWTPNRFACFLDFCRGSDQEDDGEDLASIYDHLEAWAEVTSLYILYFCTGKLLRIPSQRLSTCNFLRFFRFSHGPAKQVEDRNNCQLEGDQIVQKINRVFSKPSVAARVFHMVLSQQVAVELFVIYSWKCASV